MLVVAIVTLASLARTVQADFGDYVDPTYSCPATTTCPVVCSASLDDCPTTCDLGLQLCANGACAESCDDVISENPCTCANLTIACPKVVDLQTSCQDKYGSFYLVAEECATAELEAEIASHEVTFSDAPYVFAYIWVSVVTTMILSWCAWNQRWRPTPAVHVKSVSQDDEEPGLYQVGYKSHWLGEILYTLTLVTFGGWIMTLAFLTIQYYALDGSKYLSGRRVHFSDEEQLLKTFIVSTISFLKGLLVLYDKLISFHFQ